MGGAEIAWGEGCGEGTRKLTGRYAGDGSKWLWRAGEMSAGMSKRS